MKEYFIKSTTNSITKPNINVAIHHLKEKCKVQHKKNLKDKLEWCHKMKRDKLTKEQYCDYPCNYIHRDILNEIGLSLNTAYIDEKDRNLAGCYKCKNDAQSSTSQTQEDNNIDKLYHFTKFKVRTGRGSEEKTYIGIILNADKCKDTPDKYCFTILAQDGEVKEYNQKKFSDFKAYNINTDLLKDINYNKTTKSNQDNRKIFNAIISNMIIFKKTGKKLLNREKILYIRNNLKVKN